MMTRAERGEILLGLFDSWQEGEMPEGPLLDFLEEQGIDRDAARRLLAMLLFILREPRKAVVIKGDGLLEDAKKILEADDGYIVMVPQAPVAQPIKPFTHQPNPWELNPGDVWYNSKTGVFQNFPPSDQ